MVPLPSVTSYRHRISLDGQWSFALDPEDTGSQESWYSDRKFDASIQIPGSWEEQGYGFAPHSNPLWGWNKTHEYEGAAWYQRTVEIPSEWDGKAIELILTGVRWRSRVWIDDEYTGEQERLSVPHRYDLTEFIKPGSQHRLSIQIDNRMLYSLPESHINSLQTATRWGGITGGILLEARSKNAIQHIRCYPNVTERSFDFEVTAAIADATFEVSITNPQNGEKVTGITTLKGGSGSVSVKPGSDAPLWWDDAPFLYHAQFILRDGETILDGLEKRVGLREISVDGKQILLNGKPVFLRGYVDCCIFPLTGYPAQDIEQYRHQFKVARRHGFNHVRLHSWTAPQPFWDAADEIGMLVQTELPNWSRVYDYREIPPPSDLHRFLMHELEAIIQEYHFHPSWVMFSNGNELAGNWDGHPDLIELTARGKELDPTRLYTDQTGFGQIPAPSRPVDYYIQSCNWHPPKKIYDAATDNTAEDF
ncbi:MAG TPA: glycoside hydrolase family 2 TIM barrel-domain containing protein, partial [Aggregatilineales bacterium]|nr:glycoside hydrolase family 2 TIM barrel-domain containing protein [Aggregatilineales bacterium]